MLLPYEELLKKSVMSLQTGVELASVKEVLVDPRNLRILAYELDGRMLDTHPSFLLVDDIREFAPIGLIVDSSDEFVGPDDVIKLKEVYEFQFKLVGLDVVEQKGTKLGKVHSFNVDVGGFAVQQLIVKRPLLKSLSETQLIIHRSQIVEVTNEKVIVRTATPKEQTPVSETIRSYANPFRSSQPAGTDSIETD